MRLATVRVEGAEIAAVVLPGGVVPVREIRDLEGWPTDLFSLIEDRFRDLLRWWDGLSEDALEGLSEQDTGLGG